MHRNQVCAYRRPGFERHLAGTALLAAIALSACSQSPEGALANVSDSEVTDHVTIALQQSESLRRAGISVVTKKGDVRLSGELDSQARIDEALRIARAADGAHTIHDELRLKTPAP